MFDLDTAIAAWRRPFEAGGALADDDLEELERHVRDHTAALVGKGWAEEDAFREAVRKVGAYATAEAEYEKMRWPKAAAHGRLLSELTHQLSMLKNYLVVALRNVRRHPGYAAINVLGLAVGLAACLLIGLFVRDELSHDRFHAHADRLVRVTTTVTADGVPTAYATTAPALGPTVAEQLPGVEAAARLLVEATESSEALVSVGERRFYERHFAWTDSTFFQLFSVPLLRGDPATALTRPFTIAVSASAARRLFGEADPVGQTLRFNNTQDFEVTGVFTDMPPNGHFQFDFLASLQTFNGMGAQGMIDNWGFRAFYTYLLLEDGLLEGAAAPEALGGLEAQIAEVARPLVPDPEAVAFGLQPVPRIHLHSQLEEEIRPNGDARIVYLFACIALAILLVAAINFVNLTTARSARRAREVGVRKVVGAQRGQLVRQFLTETQLLVGAGLVLAVGLAALALPWFNGLTGAAHGVGTLAGGWLLAGLALTAVGVGLLAGVYPAVVLSGFAPMRALRGRRGSAASGHALRRGLIVLQFALSTALLVGAAVMHQQLRHMQEARLGFDREQTVALPLHEVFGQPQQDLAQLRAALAGLPGVERVAATTQLPSRVFFNNWSVRPAGGGDVREVTAFTVDPGIVPTLGLTVTAGRGFSQARDGDGGALLVNEAAVRQFGWDDPVGQTLYAADGGAAGTVVGVVEDFHYQSVDRPVGPVVLRAGEGGFQYLLVRLSGGDVAGTMRAIEAAWQAASPAWPFSAIFLDEAFGGLYRSVERAGRTAGAFAGIALLVACLGMFGLAAFAAEQRTKEVGVRKALGATVPGLVGLLSKELLTLVGVGFLIATPVAWWLAERWLSGFAYRMEVGPLVFAAAGALTLLIALLAVGGHAVRAARANPVEALRYE